MSLNIGSILTTGFAVSGFQPTLNTGESQGDRLKGYTEFGWQKIPSNLDILNSNLSNSIYDIYTQPETVILQPDSSGNKTGFRLDDIPKDSEQFILALSVSGTDLTSNNSYRFYFGINDDDSGLENGNLAYLYYDGEDNGRIKVYDSNSVQSEVFDAGVIGRRFYVRLINSNGDLHFLFSVNGTSWRVLYSEAASNFNNTWIVTDNISSSVYPTTPLYWFQHSYYLGIDPREATQEELGLARLTKTSSEVLVTANNAEPRLTSSNIEVLFAPNPEARITQTSKEILYRGDPEAQVTQTSKEILYKL